MLSSCAWATSQLVNAGRPKRDWLSGFEDACEAFALSMQNLVTDDVQTAQDHQNGGPSTGPAMRVLTVEDLRACRTAAAQAAGVKAIQASIEIRIKSQIASERNAGSGPEFLNSLIMDDLGLVAARARKDDIGHALRDYLRPKDEIDIDARIDVRHDLKAVLDAVAPTEVPAGRWPGAPGHPLR